MDDPRFAPFSQEEIEKARAEAPSARTKPLPIIPVPDDAPPLDFVHRRWGEPHRFWPYHDAQGRVLCYVYRWDLPGEDGAVRKEVRPVTYCELGDGSRGWRAKSIPAPRPLFGLPQIPARPDATVIVTEGEKACEAAAQLFPQMVATTTMMGALAPGKTDFSPLAGRTVVIATDHDDAGRRYGDSVAALLKEAGAEKVLHLKPGDIAGYIWRDGEKVLRSSPIPEGWDLADALDEGWTPESLKEHIDTGDLLQDYQPEIAEAVVIAGKFRLQPWGVEYLLKTKQDPEGFWVPLCSRLEVVAHTRNPDRKDWGLLLRITDADGREKDWVMPRSMLADDGIDCRRQLFSLGLALESGKWAQAALQEYLSGVRPKSFAVTVKETGWLEDAFVLPHRTIVPSVKAEPILYQGQVTIAHPYAASGSLEAWQQHVARYAAGNSRLAFSLSVAFVGPLLGPTHSDSCGFHLRGPSSIGKTTAVRLAASVWGGQQFIGSWRATANGLEGIAASRSDTLLILDEIGQCSAREVGEVVYMLANENGKLRSGRTGDPRPPKQWRSTVLSTGEISIADKIIEGTRTSHSKAGQEVRLIDLPADAGQGLGLFETLHDVPSADVLARHLKVACAEHHGQAGVAFLERLVADRGNAVAFVSRCREAFFASHCPAAADPQVGRVAKHFGLVAAAGELAIHFGVLPWEEGEASRAAAVCFNAWLEVRGGTEAHEERIAVEQVRYFIEQFGHSRFEHLTLRDDDGEEKKPLIRDRAGYRVSEFGKDDAYCIYPEVFRREVCRGLDYKRVRDILSGKGMLNEQPGRKAPALHPGHGQTNTFLRGQFQDLRARSR
ncbi:DUF927 domain-containing protein [Aestuariivirga sp.]|uniref:DUF927 domain-containing protein n=1 Tax=Aestuariivirga sp. TaxID=2650926 RepID=UPI00391A8D60